MATRVTYSFKEFYDLIKNKINEFSSNKPTFWGNGSIAGAFAQSVAYICEFFQLQVNITQVSTRVATAIGLHLDRRVEDFDVARTLQTSAISVQEFVGAVGRTETIIIPQDFVVETEPDYFGNTISYTLNDELSLTSGNTSITGYCTCTQAGIIGNVSSGEIIVMPTSLTGIDSTSNLEDISNGAIDESDEKLRSKVPNKVLGLKMANQDAILAAAYSVAGVTYADISENVPANGNFSLYVTTETGIVDSIIRTNVLAAINAVRAWTITPTVVYPTVSNITLEFDLTYDTTQYNLNQLTEYIQLTVKNWVNNQRLNILYISDIINIVKDIDGVIDIITVKINDIESNLSLSKLYTIKINDVSDITINT